MKNVTKSVSWVEKDSLFLNEKYGEDAKTNRYRSLRICTHVQTGHVFRPDALGHSPVL